MLNPNNPKYARAWRRPSAFFTIGEGSGDEDSDNYNEFDSDDEINEEINKQRRKSSVPFQYSSNSSLESDTELGWELAERRKNRRESIIPMQQGLQTWVDLKEEASGAGSKEDKDEGKVPGQGQLSLVQIPISRKKKNTYEEIKELLNAGKIKEAKIGVRDSEWELSDEIRSRLWPLLASIHEANKTSLDGMYWDSVGQIFGSHDALPDKQTSLPGFIDSHFHLYYSLSPEGRSFCDRVISVVGYVYPEITYCPLVLPLVSLFLHYVQEDKTYNAICTLLSARHKVFLTQTKLQWEVTCNTAMNLTKKFSKPAFALISRNLKSGETIEDVFHGWIWWIFRDLPLSHLARVVDCFLAEGIKVLYRVAISLLLSFSKSCNSDSKWSNLLQTSGVDSAMSKFCRDINLTPQRLLKSAFSIRAFRGSEIRKISTKVELMLKSHTHGAPAGKMQRSKSNENIPSSQSQLDIQMMSHTLAIKEGKSTPEHRSPAMGHYPIGDIKSIVPKESLLVLWQWLPVRITMYQPVLLYTTEEHGCSLTTFFKRVENHEPTILIIKTTNDEVFGAYCSSHWGNRNEKDERGDRQRYFGTGETFLFTLCPEKKKFPWVGIRPQTAIEDVENENEARRGRGSELFMHVDTLMISIGGGDGQGISLDENFRFGKSETCNTFDNPPLATNKDFEVSVIEVIGFTCG